MSYENAKKFYDSAYSGELNPNRESQQEYFGYGRVVHTNPHRVTLPGGKPVFLDNNMNDDNRFGNNNDHNAKVVQAQLSAYEQRASQQGLLGQQQYDPCYICRQREEDLKKQLESLTNELASEKRLVKDYKLDVLELKLEVAQLKLALAKAEK